MAHIELSNLDENALVSFSKEMEITKKTTISVKGQYKAVAYIDERLAFRIDPCLDLNIIKEYGKDFLGKKVRVAYILAKSLPQISWGFGNIQVNNERLKEAYRIGANGKLVIEVADYASLISAFASTNCITLDAVRERIISIIKTVGVPVLSACFAGTNVSIFEINSLIGEMRDSMLKALTQEKLISSMGIKVVGLTINTLHPNEDDLQTIRERING